MRMIYEIQIGCDNMINFETGYNNCVLLFLNMFICSDRGKKMAPDIFYLISYNKKKRIDKIDGEKIIFKRMPKKDG